MKKTIKIPHFYSNFNGHVIYKEQGCFMSALVSFLRRTKQEASAMIQEGTHLTEAIVSF
jgi:hypothetical protein